MKLKFLVLLTDSDAALAPPVVQNPLKKKTNEKSPQVLLGGRGSTSTRHRKTTSNESSNRQTAHVWCRLKGDGVRGGLVVVMEMWYSISVVLTSDVNTSLCEQRTSPPSHQTPSSPRRSRGAGSFFGVLRIMCPRVSCMCHLSVTLSLSSVWCLSVVFVTD